MKKSTKGIIGLLGGLVLVGLGAASLMKKDEEVELAEEERFEETEDDCDSEVESEE